MHNCESESPYQKDLAKLLQRWNMHPEYAEHFVNLKQEALKKFEAFTNEQASKMHSEGKVAATGRSRVESAQLLAGLVQHLKRAGVEYLDKHAAHKRSD